MLASSEFALSLLEPHLLNRCSVQHVLVGGNLVLNRGKLLGASLLEHDVLGGHDVELLPGAESGHLDALEHRLVDELLLFSCNLLLLQLLIPQVLLPVRNTEVGVGDVLLNCINVQVDDLSASLLIRAEVALAGVRAKVNESSTLLGLLRLVLINVCTGLRVDEGANRVANCGLLLGEHRGRVLFEINCTGDCSQEDEGKGFHY